MASSTLALVLSLLAVAAGSAHAFDNMNGEYVISRTPNATPGEFSTVWSEYSNEAGGVEYFDMYVGPITHLYGQVWWKALPEVPLPQDLLDRFDGKAMAIVGYEVDQVRKTPEGDVSVPINVAYNHHHDAIFLGKGSSMERVPYDASDPNISPMARADPNFMLVPVEHTPSPNGLPTHAHLAAGNGGEYRKSYHGFASPVAYVIESPQTLHVTPMQIDTWNRDKMNLTGSRFVPGPLPKHSLAPSGPEALYSGLLECPLTDRIEKTIEGGDGYNSTFSFDVFNCSAPAQGTTGHCEHTVATAQACFDAARQMPSLANATVKTSSGASDTLPPGCNVGVNGTVATVFFNTKPTKQCCGAGLTAVTGSVASLVAVDLSVGAGEVGLTLEGPTGVWFGVGFFAQSMADAPYTIIVDGAGAVTERRIANHAAGTLLAPSVTVVSNKVVGGKRTVVLTRKARGATPEHANFNATTLQVPIINAVGSTSALSYHRTKTASVIQLWPSEGRSVCLCEHPAAPFGSAKGTIKYLPTGEEFGFTSYCLPRPRETVLFNRNPTCDVRAYVGGLQVCKHLWTLLDADQGQPWPDQPLSYYQKYRFYYQEYKPGFHAVSVPRQGWGIAAAGGHAEYDVPKCPEGTPRENCTHTIWGVVTPDGDNLHLAAIHFHCHAPTCLAMEIWTNKTGPTGEVQPELLCRQEPIYGGTGKIDQSKFDEPGYILQPPCLWGDAPGLAPMPLASGVSFLIKAITNATYGHHGEMAFPEVTLVPWNSTSNKPLV